MKNRNDNQSLLNDIFAPSGDFRDTALDEMLSAVRRQCRGRKIRSATGVLIALVLFGVLVWPAKQPQELVVKEVPTPQIKAVEKSYAVVTTEPLSAGAIVTTQPFASESSTSAGVEIVATSAGNFRMITDEELLALVAAHPAVLVRTSRNSEQLIFVKPEDEKAFLFN